MQVAILLSTLNGARHLAAQLDSLLAQTHADWRLVWRDDGSSDRSAAILRGFADRAGAGRCIEADAAAGERLGAGASFLLLLRAARAALPSACAFAFADQDDIWLPDKLARGLADIAPHAGQPALYCARQVLVDAELAHLGLSQPLDGPRGFPAALTQNIATGCTVMLNPPAATLIAASAMPAGSLHDWWSYLVVSAAGGAIVADEVPVVLYRQHAANAVGAPVSRVRRAAAALRRGPRRFMALLRAHVAALRARPELLSPAAAADLARIDAALRGGVLRRLACLRMPGLRRQTWWEDVVFRVWFVLG
ncbi:MAG TPA: glycosyltransferase [Acetobacteraceae bacterium]|nr:glycosyltransferase [Acetobacteraceae bacterium]